MCRLDPEKWPDIHAPDNINKLVELPQQKREGVLVDTSQSHDLLDCSPGSSVVTLTTCIKLPVSVSVLLKDTDHPNVPPGQTIVKPLLCQIVPSISQHHNGRSFRRCLLICLSQ